jgi:haloalkane dehalogenase
VNLDRGEFVQQVFVELYKYNDAWRATTPAERAGFVRNVSGSLSQLTRGGVEVIAFAVNDPGTDRRAPYDFFCVYLVPDRDASESSREESRSPGGTAISTRST